MSNYNSLTWLLTTSLFCSWLIFRFRLTVCVQGPMFRHVCVPAFGTFGIPHLLAPCPFFIKILILPCIGKNENED